MPLRDVCLYAHRGDSARAPENTLPAFEAALQAGADAIELDVHLTRDGRIVVSHDGDALRMAGVTARWVDIDWAQVQALDAGYGFVAADGSRPFAGRGVRIPCFDEVLAELSGVPLNVDIKPPGPRAAAAVLDAIRRQRAEDRVVLASFHQRTLWAVRRRYAGATALSRAEVAATWLAPRWLLACQPLRGQCAQVPVRAGRVQLAQPAFIAKCHALGLRVDFWTVNDVREARELLALGADGLMTDDPHALAPVVRAWREGQGGAPGEARSPAGFAGDL